MACDVLINIRYIIIARLTSGFRYGNIIAQTPAGRMKMTRPLTIFRATILVRGKLKNFDFTAYSAFLEKVMKLELSGHAVMRRTLQV